MLINEIVQIDEFGKKDITTHIDTVGAKPTKYNNVTYNYIKAVGQWQAKGTNNYITHGSTVDKALLKLAGFDKQGYQKSQKGSMTSRIGHAHGQDTTDGSIGQRAGAAVGATVGGVIGGTAGLAVNTVKGVGRGIGKGISTAYNKTKDTFNNTTKGNDTFQRGQTVQFIAKNKKTITAVIVGPAQNGDPEQVSVSHNKQIYNIAKSRLTVVTGQ